MERKRHEGLWLVILSIIFGAIAAGSKLYLSSLRGYGDFTAIELLGWFVLFSGVVFIALLLVLYPLRLFRWLCGWFFTWRTLKRTMQVLAGLLVLIFLFYAEEDWRGKHTWEKYKRQWVEQGERLDFASFVPAAVPDDQNFALTPIVASAYGQLLTKNGKQIEPPNTNVVNRLRMQVYRASVINSSNMYMNGWRRGKLTDLKAWQTYYRTMFVTNESGVQAFATNEFPVAAQPQSPAADVLLALSKFDPVIDELRQASRLPQSRFPLNYDGLKPWDIWNPAVGSLKACADVLRLRASAELAAGQNEKAMADIKLLIQLAEAIHSEPTLNSQDYRMGVINLGLQPIWEGLVQHQWSDAQLTELAKDLSKMDFLSEGAFTARAECARGLKIIDQLRRDHNKGLLQSGCVDEEISFRTRVEMFLMSSFPSGWYYLGQRALCRAYMEGIIPTVNVHLRTIPPDRFESLMKPIYADIASKVPWNIYPHFMVPAFQPSKYARAQTGLDFTRLACALERYRILHGNYPEMLDALAPQFIVTIPHDIINGRPLNYRRTNDGTYLLYSVGWDGKDDGGVPEKPTSWPIKKEGDWVWMFPLN